MVLKTDCLICMKCSWSFILDDNYFFLFELGRVSEVETSAQVANFKSSVKCWGNLMFRVRSEHRGMNPKSECFKMHVLLKGFCEKQFFLIFCWGMGIFGAPNFFRINFLETREKKIDHFPTFHEKKILKNCFLSIITAPKCTNRQFIWPAHSKDTGQTLLQFPMVLMGN